MNHLISALLVIAILAGLVLTVMETRKAEEYTGELRDANVQSCERVNLIRHEMNTRGRILQRFLRTAASAREGAAQIQRKAGERQEARLNHRAAQLWWDFASEIENLHLPNCERKFPQ